MKASELIKLLKEAIEEHGDCNVEYVQESGCSVWWSQIPSQILFDKDKKIIIID